MSFDNLGLEPRLLKAVGDMGYERPTPIQRDAVPVVLEGRDVVGCAQTGTGKTVAFVLPVLQRLSRRPGIKALVVTPTRELALQISEVAEDAARHTGHRVAVVHGGVGYESQLEALKRGVDFLVATPGRLLDVQERGAADLRGVEVLVLDEADRMLDMGFWPQVRRIIGLLPVKRQNLLFSATMSNEVLRVVRSTLDEPVRVEVAPAGTPVEAVEQRVYPVSATQKTELLVSLLKREDMHRVLVFTRTKHRAERVHRMLERAGIKSAAIHGDRSQGQRQRALDGFREGRCDVLVATDVVARGIDVVEISHVINFDMPSTPDDYVHRIGRTARAGAAGNAISLLAAEDENTLRDIETTIGTTLVCEDLEGFAYADRVIPNPEREARRAPRVVYGGRVMGRRGGGKRITRR